MLHALGGIAEAGFFPGILLYLTYWFPSSERAKVVGLFMVARIRTKKSVPVVAPILHGIAGASGLFVLLRAVLSSDQSGGAKTALVLLLLTAVGGFTLLSFHIRKRPWPVWMVFVHAIAAVSGVLLLLLTVLGAVR